MMGQCGWASRASPLLLEEPQRQESVDANYPSPVGYVLSDDPEIRTGGLPFCSAANTIMSYRDADVTKRQVCYRRSYNVFSQVTDATTVWQEITRWSPLKFLHAPVENSC